MYNRLLLLPDLRELLVADDVTGVAEFCEALHAAAVAEVVTSFHVFLRGIPCAARLMDVNPSMHPSIFAECKRRVRMNVRTRRSRQY